MKRIRISTFFLIINSIYTLSLCVTPPPVPSNKANNLVSDKEILFGQSAMLSGSFELYGTMIKNAINACFKRVNHDGGIGGKTLRLISLDDQGDPEKAAQNVNILKSNGVSMFLGNMGTRSILKVLPRIQSKEIAMFFPWGGDDRLRDPKLSHIINGPGLLQPQLVALVEHIVNNIKHKKIAIFHADDDFSTQAANDLIKELANNTIRPTMVTVYNRFTLDIIKHADKIIETDPKIVICISTNTPTTRLIDRFFTQGHYATLFFGIDSTLFVGDILKDKGANFSYTSAVPDPRTSTTHVATEYRRDLKSYAPQETPNILSFAYYLSALILVEAMKKNPGTISKEQIIENIENMKNYDLGGFTVHFNAKNRHAFGEQISLIKG